MMTDPFDRDLARLAHIRPPASLDGLEQRVATAIDVGSSEAGGLSPRGLVLAGGAALMLGVVGGGAVAGGSRRGSGRSPSSRSMRAWRLDAVARPMSGVIGKSGRRHLLTLVIAFVAALAGVAIGCRLLMPAEPQASDIHVLIHRDIALDPKQAVALDRLEAQFAVRRAELEARLRGDNARLAAAIEAEHRDGPQVTQAIDAVHHSMGELQRRRWRMSLRCVASFAPIRRRPSIGWWRPS